MYLIDKNFLKNNISFFYFYIKILWNKFDEKNMFLLVSFECVFI